MIPACRAAPPSLEPMQDGSAVACINATEPEVNRAVAVG
jgi:hypothetical protein